MAVRCGSCGAEQPPDARDVAEAVVSLTDREWGLLSVTSVPRAVEAAGEIELLERVAEVLAEQSDKVDTPRSAIGAIVATGLAALASGRAAEAVESLREAAEWERGLGWPYRAACIDLDLVRAFAARAPTRTAPRHASEPPLSSRRCTA